MASPQSSAQSPPTISEVIEKIINTKQDGPDVDLDQLITDIDHFLALCKINQGKSSKRAKSTVDWLPSASNAAKITEGVSENFNKLAKEISEYSGKEHSTAISVLRAAGNVHWAGLGLLLVAAVLNRVDTIKKNKEECVKLLKLMNELAKVVRKLKEIPGAKNEMQTQINESIAFIVQGAILCCSQRKTRFRRFVHASKDRDELIKLHSKVDEMYERLNSNMNVQNISISTQSLSISEQNLSISTQSLSVVEQINTQVLSILQNSSKCNRPPIHSVEHAVGIQEQIDEVVKLLQWENDTPSVAVVVHGLGGTGKTTLGDGVYDSLRDKLNGWKYSKIILIQNLEEDPKVEKLQSLILGHLTGEKEEVSDVESGRQKLKEIMQKESIFLYIDNVLRDPLQQLLPREIRNPKKLRLLLTARKTNFSNIMEDCKIKYEIYPIKPLPLDAAIQVLGKKIDPNRDTNSLSEDRPEVKMIAQRCRSWPLLLEVVGGFVRRRRNKDEAYERVLKWMENGEHFSGDKEDRLYEGRIMFAYDQLEPPTQEAFLDICSYYYLWEWEEVARIVGDDAMECLEEGALIKRKQQTSYQIKSVTGIGIHDLLLKIGRTKSKDSRFRTVEEFTRALQNHSELLHQTKGLWLTQTERESPGPIEVSAEVLDKMSGSLRVFAMGNWTIVKGKCRKSFNKLSYLQAGAVQNIPMDMSELTSLTYMNCISFKGIIRLTQLKNLSSLKVIKIETPTDGWKPNEISEFCHSNKLMPLVLREGAGTVITGSVNICRLRKLQLLDRSTSDLMQLEKSLGKLTSLQELCLDNCAGLKQLPAGFGKLKALVCLSLTCCNSLEELPKDFVELSSLQYLDLSHCKKLRELPGNIEKLASLQCLDLSHCEKLRELPGNIEKLTPLRSLIFEGCSSLHMLPEQLGNLQSLSRITFRKCKNLSILPQSLGGIIPLLMSHISFEECCNLRELPEEMFWLSSMKSISFKYCTSLKRLPTQFCKLIGLERLGMCGCNSLSNLPPDFGKLKSLQFLNLSECDKLEELSGDFHCLGALKELNLSKCIMLGKLSEDFCSLPSLTKLEFSNCERLGGEWMDSVGAIKSLLNLDISGSNGMVQRWIEMQWEKEQWHFLVNSVVQDSNAWILAKFFATHRTDFLIHINKKVEVNDLKGKVVLLLITRSTKRSLEISALEDVYGKLQQSSACQAEVVCIPPKGQRAVSSAPWPFLINEGLSPLNRSSTQLVVLNEKGSISQEDAMHMIWRWGIKAYPFSASREEELRKTEWERLNLSSQSSLEFVFENLELFQSKVREARPNGETIFVCVGPIKKMLEFLPELNCALRKLEKVVQVFYVGEGVEYLGYEMARFDEGEKEYEMKREKEMCSITSLSLCDVHKFWERVKYLWDELGRQGDEERIVQVRSMVLAFLSACDWRKRLRELTAADERLAEEMAGIEEMLRPLEARREEETLFLMEALREDMEDVRRKQRTAAKERKGISIVAVDENGEMINGLAEEVVQMLCQTDQEEEHHKLMGEIKSEGFTNVLRRRETTIRPKSHPHHPLFFKLGGSTCNACSRSIKRDWFLSSYSISYRCSICKNYEMCEKCFYKE